MKGGRGWVVGDVGVSDVDEVFEAVGLGFEVVDADSDAGVLGESASKDVVLDEEHLEADGTI